MAAAKKPGLTRNPEGSRQKLTLNSVNGKKVKAPKGTKTVTQNNNGNLVYKDKNGKPIKKRGK